MLSNVTYVCIYMEKRRYMRVYSNDCWRHGKFNFQSYISLTRYYYRYNIRSKRIFTCHTVVFISDRMTHELFFPNVICKRVCAEERHIRYTIRVLYTYIRYRLQRRTPRLFGVFLFFFDDRSAFINHRVYIHIYTRVGCS